MIYASVCTGIEAATVAWHPLGWTPVWFSEIEPFPCKLLNHYYPDVPNLGDMLQIHNHDEFRKSTIDLLVGGTPCKSFSIAGLRGGLTDPRGNLALQFCRILTIKRPRWFIWENVPGVFSSSKGEDFRSILRGFSECGYSCAWRVLDAQFFGVPQRRRRVFVVGYLGDDWRPPAAVLFEPQGMRRHIKKGGKPRTDITGTIGRCSKGRLAGADEAAAGQIIVSSLTTRPYADNESSEEKLIISPLIMSTGQPNAEILENISPTLNCNHEQPIIFPYNQITSKLNRSNPKEGDPAPTLSKKDNKPLLVSTCWSIMPQNSGKDYKAREVEVTQPLTTNKSIANNGGDIIQQTVQSFQSSQSGVRLGETHATLDKNNGSRRHNGIIEGNIVRRLTPLECERLQGFPDGYTDIPGASDTVRYESLGNSMATKVMRWLGIRIDLVDKQLNK